MPRLGVLGWPVGHSRSPAMHRAALSQLGMAGWHYQRLPVPPALFAETTRALEGAGFAGANVTIPHKHAALELADSASAAAREIGAANTLSFVQGAIVAENTDAPGFLAALGVSVRGLRALVLGAGGSARAVVWALAGAGAATISVWNRTPERARALADELGASATDSIGPADVLVNCTSVGMGDSSAEGLSLKDLPGVSDQLGGYAHVVDLVYRTGGTQLAREARARNAHVVDGLEVLTRQGALSFAIWTGRPAPVDAMLAAVRAQDAD